MTNYDKLFGLVDMLGQDSEFRIVGTLIRDTRIDVPYIKIDSITKITGQYRDEKYFVIISTNEDEVALTIKIDPLKYQVCFDDNVRNNIYLLQSAFGLIFSTYNCYPKLASITK